MKIRQCKARDYLKPIKSPQFVLLAHLVIIATCAYLSYKSKVPTQFQAIERTFLHPTYCVQAIIWLLDGNPLPR
jgi:hypothetical protein